MGFLLKYVIGTLLMPLPGTILLAVVGWVVWSRGRHKRVGQLLTGGALVLLWGLSCAPVAKHMVGGLENAYPAFPGDSVDFVVVLGSSHVSDPRLPVSSLLSGNGLFRLTEGLRIAVAEPWSTLVVSGWGGADPVSDAMVYRRVAMALGFDSTRIHTESRPKDTRQEAELLAPLLHGHRFALVTSATHMPRAMQLFRDRGLDPVAAPTRFLLKSPRAFDWMELLPDENALALTRLAWHERLGSIWAALTGG